MRRNENIFKGKRLVVTGGKGFIGRELVKRLESEEAEVLVVDKKDGLDTSDWLEISSIRKFNNIFCLYHLAAETFVPFSWENPLQVYRSNIISTLNILELCRKRNIKKVVFISSYVYGNPFYLPIDENHPVNPANPYAWSKFIGENICKAYSKDFGLRCVILRPFNIYGYGQNLEFLIPSILSQIKKKDSVVLNDPMPKRDFLFLSDMVEALIAAGRYAPENIEIFNIGSGKSYSVREIVKIIVGFEKKPIKVKFLMRNRKSEVLNIVANTLKAQKKLGWRPKIDIREGLYRAYKNINKHQC